MRSHSPPTARHVHTARGHVAQSERSGDPPEARRPGSMWHSRPRLCALAHQIMWHSRPRPSHWS